MNKKLFFLFILFTPSCFLGGMQQKDSANVKQPLNKLIIAFRINEYGGGVFNAIPTRAYITHHKEDFISRKQATKLEKLFEMLEEESFTIVVSRKSDDFELMFFIKKLQDATRKLPEFENCVYPIFYQTKKQLESIKNSEYVSLEKFSRELQQFHAVCHRGSDFMGDVTTIKTKDLILLRECNKSKLTRTSHSCSKELINEPSSFTPSSGGAFKPLQS